MSTLLKPLTDLSADQLTFLKQQVGTNASKLGLRITRDQARLDNKLDRQSENRDRLLQLEDELQKKKNVLEVLQNADNIDAEIIANQEEDVLKAEKDLERLQGGPNALTDVEAYIEQYEINLLQQEKTFYEGKFTEIETELGNRSN